MIEIHKKFNVTATEDTDNPFLQGAFAPNDTEYTATSDSLKVIGEIPKDLNGVYVRNTHNQVHKPLGLYHPFDGDAMLHALHFENGKVTYRNRFVETIGFLAEQGAGKSLWPGLLEPDMYTARGWGAIGAMKDNAGTDVIGHAGQLISVMSQGSEPYRLDPVTLENTEISKWGKHIQPNGVSAHFKVDIYTGEMMFFNFGEEYPYMNYGVIDRNNELVHYVPIDIPGPRWPHDLGVSKNYTILHDLPMFVSEEDQKKGKRQTTFFEDVPSRFGVIPRYGKTEDVKWFEGSPCYILHLSNCHEEGDEVIMDACVSFQPKMPDVGGGNNDPYTKILAHLDKHNTQTHMRRFRFNMKTGNTIEEEIDDEVTEFPIVPNEYVGLKNRYAYNTLFEKGNWLFIGIKKYDLLTGDATRFEYGPGRYGDEPQIAREPDAKEEDDGYIVTMVLDTKENQSEVVIIDAKEIERGPVARIILPHVIQTGTHAAWIEADRLKGERPPSEYPEGR